MTTTDDKTVIDLVTFLAARLREDEAKAKAAMPSPWLHMNLGSEGCAVVRRQLAREGRPCRVYFRSNDLSVDHATAEHVATHDPARVLREVEAKRRILADYVTAVRPKPMSADDPRYLAAVVLQRAVCALAAVYSDHRDYTLLPIGMEQGPIWP